MFALLTIALKRLERWYETGLGRQRPWLANGQAHRPWEHKSRPCFHVVAVLGIRVRRLRTMSKLEVASRRRHH